LKEKKQCTVERLLFLAFVRLDNHIGLFRLAEKKRKQIYCIDKQKLKTTKISEGLTKNYHCSVTNNR